MTLPYPHEIETKRLKPVGGAGPDPLDIEQRVSRLIAPEDGCVDVAGHRLQVVGTRTAQAEAERMRGLVSRRLLERRPNADEATWRKLAESLSAALSSHRGLDDDAIEQSLLVIDGL